jgi:hypothetical protein
MLKLELYPDLPIMSYVYEICSWTSVIIVRMRKTFIACFSHFAAKDRFRHLYGRCLTLLEIMFRHSDGFLRTLILESSHETSLHLYTSNIFFTLWNRQSSLFRLHLLGPFLQWFSSVSASILFIV